jgi:multiple sugar transport system ATP-binding protein
VVTCQLGKAQVLVKTDKNFDLPPDAAVGLVIDRSKLCVFDAGNGDRVAPDA